MSAVSRVQKDGGHLLEREDTLDALRGGLSDVRAGAGRLVLLAAEAGGGKTALTETFCAEVGRGVRVLRGACDPLHTPRPLGPFTDVAVQTDGALAERVDAGAPPHQVFTALSAELQRAPTILVLEDAHWADEASLDVLRLLGRRVGDLPVLVVTTYRDDELANTHPLRSVVSDLARLPTTRRVQLDPLSEGAVAELADPVGVDAEELYRRTGGNPFFVTEVLAAPGQQIPATVRDAVLVRTARLSDDARALLEAVAVAPPSVAVPLLEEMVGDARGLEECLASGVLVPAGAGMAFRHELARLAIEVSIPPDRRRVLHGRALEGLVSSPGGALDLARLAHHADAADDGDAVLRFAPAAAARAASLGAHREAAAQYVRALRFADRLEPAERASILARYSHECYLTDQADEAIAALHDAASCYHGLGDRLREGDALRRLSNILWCPGRGREALPVGLEAVALLEQLTPAAELVAAYENLSFLLRMKGDVESARDWGARALELAERLDDRAVLSGALLTVGMLEGRDPLERGLALAQAAGRPELVVDGLLGLAVVYADQCDYEAADRKIELGVAYCSEHEYDLMQLYFLALRAHTQLERGQWTQAAESAGLVLAERAISTFPRTQGLVVLGLVRARRGDPDAESQLEAARALAEPTGELHRVVPVALARAEVAWLRGERETVLAVTEDALALAMEARSPRALGPLRVWRRRAGRDERVESFLEDPYASELAGDWKRAAELWQDFDRPYDAALAQVAADEETALRDALDVCQQLGARPLAAIVRRTLLEQGARNVPRGPRASTRRNAAQLTGRELEVLQLAADGLRNAEIADRLVLSRRTVDHHVSAILRKLDATTRGEAVASARRLGALEDGQSHGAT